MIREISIFGSWGATDVFSGTTVDKTKAYKNDPGTTRDPVPILCRKLKALGLAAEDDIVVVTRDGKRVFKTDLPLSWWADHDCAESRNEGLRWQKYVPYPEGVHSPEGF
jgi:hypothetical protein